MVSDLGLQECIRNYDRENDRRKSLESKASYILAITSLFVSVWSIFVNHVLESTISIKLLIIGLNIILFILIVLCALYSFNVLKLSKYRIPLVDPDSEVPDSEVIDLDEIHRKLSLNSTELRENLYYSYLSSYSLNYDKNELNVNRLKIAYRLLLYIILMAITILLTFLIGLLMF